MGWRGKHDDCVRSMALDTVHCILYTGTDDGCLAAWAVHWDHAVPGPISIGASTECLWHAKAVQGRPRCMSLDVQHGVLYIAADRSLSAFAARGHRDPELQHRSSLLWCKNTAHNGTIWCMALDDDSGFLFTGSEDSEVRAWKTGREMPDLPMKGKGPHADAVRCMVLDSSTHTLYTSSDDHSLAAWDVHTIVQSYEVPIKKVQDAMSNQSYEVHDSRQPNGLGLSLVECPRRWAFGVPETGQVPILFNVSGTLVQRWQIQKAFSGMVACMCLLPSSNTRAGVQKKQLPLRA